MSRNTQWTHNITCITYNFNFLVLVLMRHSYRIVQFKNICYWNRYHKKKKSNLGIHRLHETQGLLSEKYQLVVIDDPLLIRSAFQQPKQFASVERMDCIVSGIGRRHRPYFGTPARGWGAAADEPRRPVGADEARGPSRPPDGRGRRRPDESERRRGFASPVLRRRRRWRGPPPAPPGNAAGRVPAPVGRRGRFIYLYDCNETFWIMLDLLRKNCRNQDDSNEILLNNGVRFIAWEFS